LKFSIIIPVKSINAYVRETVPHLKALKGFPWELFIIPNNKEKNEWPNDERISVIDSGKLGPADKRDLGANISSGDILVFLDDDSYPEANILEIANNYFTDTNIIALGGPGITPPSDNFWQRVSGAVYLSKFTGGSPERYVPIGKSRAIDDWPSVNLMVRKDIFLSVGGFDCKYWPGEDTKLCLKLKNTGKKIIYAPDMIVWHHRRGEIMSHLKQVGAYGLHRGFFAKEHPETSFKLKYFLPSIFSLFFLISPFYLLFPELIHFILIAGWTVYLACLFIGGYQIFKYENLLITITSILLVIPTHFYYGCNFIYGFLFKKKLVSVLR
jgi:GT2 family glycosyltransferase